MKWIWVIILAIIGILAAIVAVEYLTVSIGHLPSFIPGHKHKGHGHYHKRGAIAAVIAFVAFVVAGFLAFRFLRTQPAGSSAAPPATRGTSADQILSGPAPEPTPAPAPEPTPAPQPGPADDQ
jgi:hypothetical protein